MASHPHRRPKVLLVEDHATLARLTAQLIREANCDVIGPARSIRDARELLTADQPDLALVDLSLPDGSGEQLIHDLRGVGVACMVLSGSAPQSEAPPALADVPWLEKPIDPELLAKILERIRPPTS